MGISLPHLFRKCTKYLAKALRTKCSTCSKPSLTVERKPTAKDIQPERRNGRKTGTTQNQSDGWFMSFTPSIAVGCCVGGEDRSIHFDRMAYGQGASMALSIHGLFYQKIYSDHTLNMSDNGVLMFRLNIKILVQE